MKILCMIPVWRRPEITQICFRGVKRLQKECKHLIDVLVLASERWALELSAEYDFRSLLIDNDPLGFKMNAGLKYAMRYEWDYLMTLGSDDLINSELFDYYEPYFGNTDLFGVDTCCFSNGYEAKIVNTNLQIFGAGRMISRKVIERVACNNSKVQFLKGIATSLAGYNKGEITYLKATLAMEWMKLGYLHIISTGHVKLWRDHLNSCLDTSANIKLIVNKASNKVIDIGNKPLIVDMKTGDNIWKYDDFKGEPIEIKEIKIPEHDLFRQIRQSCHVFN